MTYPRAASRCFSMILGLSVLIGGMATIARPAFASTTCVFTTASTTDTLLGNCTTDATILVADGHTLNGNGFTITAVDPTGDHFHGAVVKNGGGTANVVNLTVEALALADVCDGGNDRLRGILFDGASGSITGNTV